MAKPAALDCCWMHSMTLENVQLEAYPEWILPRWVHRWSPVYGGSSILSHLWTSRSSWIACLGVAALLFQTHTHTCWQLLPERHNRTPLISMQTPFGNGTSWMPSACSILKGTIIVTAQCWHFSFFLSFFFLTGYNFLQHNNELIPILLLQSYFAGNFTLTSFSLFSVCLLHD